MKTFFVHIKCLRAVLFFLAFTEMSAFAKEEGLRLVVSGGALSESRVPFYDSRIFVAEKNPPFEVQKITSAWVSENVVIFSEDDIDKSAIVKAKHVQPSEIKQGFIGQSYRGFSLESQPSAELRRYLGADPTTFLLEQRTVLGKPVFAMTIKDAKTLTWPTSESALIKTSAAIVKEKTGALHVVVARNVGGFAHRLGLVDELLISRDNTLFLELGSNHGVSDEISKEKTLRLLERKPDAIFSGSFEMASLLNNDDVKALPHVYPFGDSFTRSLNIKGFGRVDLWSAAGSENLWPLFSKLGKIKNSADAISTMQTNAKGDPNTTLNIVRVFSEEAAIDVAKSPFVDLVLVLSKDPEVQLPSYEVIELKGRAGESTGLVAPIVKISYLDIAEIITSGPTRFNVTRAEIRRYPISDLSPKAKDMSAHPSSTLKGLPSLNDVYQQENRAWTNGDFERVLGGIMLSNTDADLALFERSLVTTKIHREIPFDAAWQMLSPQGNVVVITTSGKQVKNILKLLKNDANNKIVAYGIDTKTNMIGGRSINDNEKFTIALSEAALLQVFGFARLGGLSETFAIRAPFVEAIYGSDMKSIYFIGGPKVIPIADTAEEVQTAIKNVQSGTSFNEMLSTFFMRETNDQVRTFIDVPYGAPRHVITLDIAYLDVGLSKSVSNTVYDEYRKGEGKLPMGRAKVAPLARIFIFAKSSLNYDAPMLLTSLSGEIKYIHTNLGEHPEKDKTKVALRFRLPWERSIFAEKPVVISPVSHTVYETKLVPHFFSRPEKDKGPRTQKIDTLLGFNFNFVNLGFNFDLGGVMATDFTRSSVSNALDFGPGLNFYSKWTLFGPVELSSEITSYYLFGLPNHTATNKVALGVEGTIWLRLVRFHDFSVSIISDLLLASLQSEPKSIAASSIFGLTISYGRLFRLLG